MSGGEIALVVAAMFAAGFLNAAAGGGSLVSFPALVAVGLDPLTANVSNTLALWPGYLSGAASLRPNLRRGLHLRQLCLAAGIGAVGGSVLLLVADSSVFDAVVPFLVLLAAVLLAIPQRWLVPGRPPAGHDATAEPAGVRPVALLIVGLGGAYGAYFGGALGVVLLALLSAFVGGDLRSLNATKTVLSLLVNTVALVAFVGFAPVDWTAVAIGAPASLVGGLAGGWSSTRINPGLLRWAIVAYATTAGLILLFT